MPVARTTKSYAPGAIVPVLIDRVLSVPLPADGVTELGLKVIGPTPDGSGVSTLSVTAFPKLAPVFRRLRVKETVSPGLGATPTLDEDVNVKSRLTPPTLIANGSFFTVRYGLPAWPWIQSV